jgi:hypothetical protein
MPWCILGTDINMASRLYVIEDESLSSPSERKLCYNPQTERTQIENIRQTTKYDD